MTKRVTFFLLIGIFVFFVFGYFNKPSAVDSNESSANKVALEFKKEEKTSVKNKTREDWNIESVAECREFDDVYARAVQTQKKKVLDTISKNHTPKHNTLPKSEEYDFLLNQGYSDTEIAHYIEFLSNRNYSTTWLNRQRSKKSMYFARLNESNNKMRGEIFDFFKGKEGENLKSSPFIFEKTAEFPQEHFLNFEQLNMTDQLSLLGDNKVDINDIAYFLSDKPVIEIGDEVISAMVGRLDENDRTVYTNRIISKVYSGNLLDHAAISGRSNVYNELIRLGFEPSNDRYFKNTLEYLFSGLFDKSTGKVLPGMEKQVSTIRNLAQRNNLKIRYSQPYFPDDVVVYGGIRFTVEKQNDLLSLYNFDLSVLPTQSWKEFRKSDERLIDEFYLKTNDHLELNYGVSDSVKVKEYCSSINQQKKQICEQGDNIIRNARDRFDGDTLSLQKYLHNIEPSLHDSVVFDRKIMEPVSDPIVRRLAFSYSDPNTIHEIFNNLSLDKHQELYDALCNRWGSIRNQTKFMSFLDSGLRPNDLNSCSFSFLGAMNVESIKSLEALGLDIYKIDKNTKSLAYYSAADENLELFNYLMERGVSVDANLGADVLHYLLNEIYFTYSGAPLENSSQYVLLNSLFKVDVDIKEHHLSIMLLIQQDLPKLYEALLKLNIDLKVMKSTKSPVGLACAPGPSAFF